MESIVHLLRYGLKEETERIMTGSRSEQIIFLRLARILEFLNYDLTLFIRLLNIYKVLLCAKHGVPAEDTTLSMIEVPDDE